MLNVIWHAAGQQWNAASPILVNELGKVNDVNEEHDANAPVPIDLTVSGITNDVNE